MKLLKPVLLNVLFALLLALPPAAVLFTGRAGLLIPHFWLMYTFITGLTFISVTTMLVVQSLQPGMYAQVFLIVTIFKMLTSMLLALIFVLKVHVDQAVFLANFSYLYFLNTGFEVYVLLRKLRNQNRK